MRGWMVRAGALLTCSLVVVGAAGTAEAQDGETRVGPPATVDDGGGSVAPYVLMAAGGAMVIGGTVTGFLALSIQSELDDVCGYDGVCPTDREADAEDGETLATTTDVLLAAGVVTLGIGLAVWLIEAEEEPSGPGVSASIGCGPGGCGAAMQGRF